MIAHHRECFAACEPVSLEPLEVACVCDADRGEFIIEGHSRILRHRVISLRALRVKPLLHLVDACE